MSSEEFISLLNGKLQGLTMQIIPSHSFKKLPPTPFATWNVSEDVEEVMTVLDGRELIGTDIEDKANFYEKPALIIKTYSYIRSEAKSEAQKLYRNIKFAWRDEIIRIGYGIIDISNDGWSQEKLDSGQNLHYYTISVTIDYNNEESRLTPQLEEVIIEGDIDLTIPMI